MRIRVKHTQKVTRRKKGNENEDGFLEEMIGQEEEEEEEEGEEEEDTQEGKADNNKANNDDAKRVWYRFGSLANTIDRSNRIMADFFVDHYYTVLRSILFVNDPKRYQTVRTATF